MALGLIVAGAAVAMRFLFEGLSAVLRAALAAAAVAVVLLLAHLAMGWRVTSDAFKRYVPDTESGLRPNYSF
jgi:hypothetical protein